MTPLFSRTRLALMLAVLTGLSLGACTTIAPEPEDDVARHASRVPVMTIPVTGAPAPDPLTQAPRDVEEGMASWYGARFHGRLTANGEVFDIDALTAAHPTLPMPSLARITRLDTGASVIVRINDRGPFVEGRIIDLSRAAAEALGFLGEGLAEVRVEAYGPADPEDRAAISGPLARRTVTTAPGAANR